MASSREKRSRFWYDETIGGNSRLFTLFKDSAHLIGQRSGKNLSLFYRTRYSSRL